MKCPAAGVGGGVGGGVARVCDVGSVVREGPPTGGGGHHAAGTKALSTAAQYPPSPPVTLGARHTEARVPGAGRAGVVGEGHDVEDAYNTN